MVNYTPPNSNYDELLANSLIPLSQMDKLDDEFLSCVFSIINYTHFDQSLPYCRVKWSDRIGMGKHCHRLSDFTVFDDMQFPSVIRLSKNLLSAEDLRKISEALYYAMIHIWLWSQKKPWGHTKEFYEKAELFNYSLIKAKTDYK